MPINTTGIAGRSLLGQSSRASRDEATTGLTLIIRFHTRLCLSISAMHGPLADGQAAERLLTKATTPYIRLTVF